MTPKEARLAPLATRPDLVGPRHDAVGGESESGTITGQGLVASVHRERGLTGLWTDGTALTRGLIVRWGNEGVSPQSRFSWGQGRWAGTYTVPSGIRILEIGLLPDSAGVALVQWSIVGTAASTEAATSLTVALEPGGQGVPIPLDDDGRAIAAIVPAGGALAAAQVTPVSARERQRIARHLPVGGRSAAILVDGRPSGALDAAIRCLEEATLGDPHRTDGPAIVDIVTDRGPRYLEAGRFAVVGAAALAVGRTALARACLAGLAGRTGHAPEALLWLTAEYHLWTADGTTLSTMEPALVQAIRTVSQPGTRAHTAPGGVPDAFAHLRSAIEGAGLARLHEAVENAERTRGESVSDGGRALPMVGNGDASRAATSRSGSASRPRPSGLSHPDSAVAAAEVILAWTRAHLAVRPEAAYGRTTIEPRFSERWRTVTLSDLPIGDGALTVTLARYEDRRFEIRLAQPRGRVPANLVCQARFPLTGRVDVRIDGESTNISGAGDAEGTLVRFQLPVDAERHITISFPQE